jgi:predicted RNase H-like HicB family nuclease
MTFDDYKIVIYPQDDRSSYVAEIPAIAGCYALVKTRKAALAELSNVFQMIAEEYREKRPELPIDATAIVNS